MNTEKKLMELQEAILRIVDCIHLRPVSEENTKWILSAIDFSNKPEERKT